MLIVLLVLLGLCFGSFVNALIWRLHYQEKKSSKFKSQDLSIVKGRSMCMHCKHPLAAADLVPVISWFMLRGKCRYCKKPIPDTPVAELLTPALFLLSYFAWPYGFSGLGTFMFVVWLVLVVGFVALVLYDVRWQILPNKIVYVLLGIVMVQLVVQLATGAGLQHALGAVWGILCGAGIFWALYQFSDGRLIGGGDVKLGLVYGILLGGPVNSLLCIFIASLLGTFAALPMVLAGKTSKSSRIPFGPYLIIATIIVYLFGMHFVSWYRATAGI